MKKLVKAMRLTAVTAPVLALLLCGSAPQSRAAAFDTPVGDWDFYFGGSQRGVAQITFLGNNTLNGFEILMPKFRKAPQSNPRGGTIDTDSDPRTGTPDNSNTNAAAYGGALIDGFWGFDEKGRIVGTITLASSSSTNGLSFVGSVTAATRMTLRASDVNGSSVYRGVPRAALPDISGIYSAYGKKGKTRHTEILDLTASGSPNVYDIAGHGPGYDGTGLALLTSNNRFGIYYEVGTTNPSIVALSGTFSPTRLKGSVTGTDGTNNISLKIVLPQP